MLGVHDVAAYIVANLGSTTMRKLHALAYYSQAWSLARLERLLFTARIEAWPDGPVIPELYRIHRRINSSVYSWERGCADRLDHYEKNLIGLVLSFYGEGTAQSLSELAKSEKPWLDARKVAGRTAKGLITPASMYDYYRKL